MALVVKDRVQETTTTTGTGTLTLAGAVSGFQSFSVIGNGNTTYYSITGGAQWEIGIGTYTASGTTLSRDTVLESSNSGSLVDFSAGTKTVFCTYPAERSMYVDGTTITPATTATLPVVSGGTGSNTATFSGANITSLNASSVSSGTLGATYGGTGQSSLTANNVILGNGTSAVQFVAPGTSSNVLTSNGTTWVSQAAGGGGGSYVYINTYTASTSVVDITGLNFSTYFQYMVLFHNVRSTLGCRFFFSGVINTTNSYAFATIFQTGDNTSTPQGTASASAATGIGLCTTATSTANTGWSGVVYLSANSGRGNVFGMAGMTQNMTTQIYSGIFTGNTTPYDGVRFTVSGSYGNLASGTFKLYGMKSS